MIKKITIITSNFYPEDTAIGLYTTQLSEYLAIKGFEITVVTGFPYYPNWSIFKDYTSKSLFYQEDYNGIKIIRFKQYVPSKITLLSRIMMIMSFNFGLLINLFKIKKTDLIISIIPFTTNCLFGKIASVCYRAKFWVHIQDFEFDLLIDSGIAKKKGITKMFFKLLLFFESRMLNSADVISTISNAMIKKTLEKSKLKDVFYFPNWVSIKNINPDTSKQHSYFDKSKFNILYSGNIGEKQDWDFFIDFCKFIQDDDNIIITIVGKGAYYKTLVDRCIPFKFIVFKDIVPYESLSDLLCSADLHFLFQKTNVVDSVMPSKLLGMMASAKPCIVTGNIKSEVKTILEESTGGKYFSSGNASEVYSFVKSIMSDSCLSNKMGAAARDYIGLRFSEKAVLNSFINKISTLNNEK